MRVIPALLAAGLLFGVAACDDGEEVENGHEIVQPGPGEQRVVPTPVPEVAPPVVDPQPMPPTTEKVD